MTRARWPRYGSSSSSIRASVPRGSRGQRIRHQVGQVEVADAHRVHVAQRPHADLARGPRPDPGHGRQPCIGVGQRQLDDRLEPAAPEPRPAGSGLRAGVRRPADGRRSRGARRVTAGAGGTRKPSSGGPGAASPYRQTNSNHARAGLFADHLLFEDRRNQQFEHGAASAGSERRGTGAPDATPSGGLQRDGAGAWSSPSERRHAIEGALSAGTPGLGAQTARRVLQRDGRRAIWRAGRPPGPVATNRSVRSPGPRPSGESVRRMSSGPSTGTVLDNIAMILTRPGFVSEYRRIPADRAFHAMLAKTCDAPGSSRVRRSSPCSPWSPSPAQLARRPPTSNRKRIRTSSNA